MGEAADLISKLAVEHMYSVTVSDSIARRTLPRSPTPETIESGAPRFEVRPLVPDPATAGESAPLLLAALEEIESRRAALEWLLENDLLRHCLV
jgi:hypothetical protein